MAISITESELLDALAAAVPGTAPEDARTVQEMCAASGANPDRIRRALRVVAAEGRLGVHRVVRRAIDGRPAPVSAYTIAPKAKSPKSKR